MATMKIINLQAVHEGCKGKITSDEMNERNKKFAEYSKSNSLEESLIFCPFCNQVFKIEFTTMGDLEKELYITNKN